MYFWSQQEHFETNIDFVKTYIKYANRQENIKVSALS